MLKHQMAQHEKTLQWDRSMRAYHTGDAHPILHPLSPRALSELGSGRPKDHLSFCTSKNTMINRNVMIGRALEEPHDCGTLCSEGRKKMFKPLPYHCLDQIIYLLSLRGIHLSNTQKNTHLLKFIHI